MLQALIQVNTEHQRQMRIPTNFYFFSLSTHDDCPIDQGSKHLWSDIQLHCYFTAHNIKRRGDESFALRRDTVTTASCAQTAAGVKTNKVECGPFTELQRSCKSLCKGSADPPLLWRSLAEAGALISPPPLWLYLRCDVSADGWEGSGGGGGGKSPSVGARSETCELSALLIVLQR